MTANIMSTGQSHCSKTVRFDVGGHIYKVSRSLIELYPDTMLARMVDAKWQQHKQRHGNKNDNDDDDGDGSTILFIDRNGDRFQYVLDYMRDRQVSLPMTVSVSAFRQDLDYYGFDNAQESSSMITVGTPAEVGSLFATLVGNVYDDLDKFDEQIKESEKKIETLKQQKCSLKMAHDVFERSVKSTMMMQEVGNNGPSCTIRFAREDGKIALDYSECDCRFLREYLKSYYGLDLVSVSCSGYGNPYRVVVKRCITAAGNDGNGSSYKAPSRIWAQPDHVFASFNESAEKEQQQGVVSKRVCLCVSTLGHPSTFYIVLPMILWFVLCFYRLELL